MIHRATPRVIQYAIRRQIGDRRRHRERFPLNAAHRRDRRGARHVGPGSARRGLRRRAVRPS